MAVPSRRRPMSMRSASCCSDSWAAVIRRTGAGSPMPGSRRRRSTDSRVVYRPPFPIPPRHRWCSPGARPRARRRPPGCAAFSTAISTPSSRRRSRAIRVNVTLPPRDLQTTCAASRSINRSPRGATHFATAPPNSSGVSPRRLGAGPCRNERDRIAQNGFPSRHRACRIRTTDDLARVLLRDVTHRGRFSASWALAAAGCGLRSSVTRHIRSPCAPEDS